MKLHSVLTDIELDAVAGGDKNAKGQTVPKKPKPPVNDPPMGWLGPAFTIRF